MCVPGELQLGKGKAGEGQSILQRVNGTERRETRQLWNRPEDNLVAKVGCSSPTHWDSSPLGAATGRVLLSGSKSSPWEDLKGALWKGEKRGPPGDLSPPRTERFPAPSPSSAPQRCSGDAGPAEGERAPRSAGNPRNGARCGTAAPALPAGPGQGAGSWSSAEVPGPGYLRRVRRSSRVGVPPTAVSVSPPLSEEPAWHQPSPSPSCSTRLAQGEERMGTQRAVGVMGRAPRGQQGDRKSAAHAPTFPPSPPSHSPGVFVMAEHHWAVRYPRAKGQTLAPSRVSIVHLPLRQEFSPCCLPQHPVCQKPRFTFFS